MPKIASSATNTVPVLAKALRVFAAVAQSPHGATTKSLALSLGIAPSTCYRILQTFVAAGWLRNSPGGVFELSYVLVPLLRPLLRHEVLIESVRKPMHQLAAATGLTAKLTIRQGDDSVTIFSAPSPRPHAIASRIGAVVSLAIGSSGAIYLSALPQAEIKRILDAAPLAAWKFQKRDQVLRRVREARRLGYCADTGSYADNIHTLSAPLFAQSREPIAAITLLGFPGDFAGAAKGALARALLATATACHQSLQGLSSA